MKTGPILVVEDNPINLKLLRLVLAIDGFDVLVAADAEQALDILKRVTPSLIIMDIQLPGMDGLELGRIIKNRDSTRDVKIVAVTAYAMKGDDEKALSVGFDGYVLKPIDTRSLASEVARHLADD